jgi:hypothetical protein
VYLKGKINKYNKRTVNSLLNRRNNLVGKADGKLKGVIPDTKNTFTTTFRTGTMIRNTITGNAVAKAVINEVKAVDDVVNK